MIMKHMSRVMFSSTEKLADWQYVSKIHNSLKQSNINEAMRYLINSHLDGIILDRQTFYNIYLKMNEAKVNTSYLQLAYKLYRDTFSPHILMSEWMKGLANTKNKKLQQLLTNDFQTLNIQMPKSQTKIKTSQSKKDEKETELNQNLNALQDKQGITLPFGEVKMDFSISEINTEITKLIQQNGLKIVVHNLEFEKSEEEFEEGSDKIIKMEDFLNEDNEEEQRTQLLELVLESMITTPFKIEKVQIMLDGNKTNLNPTGDEKDKK